MYAGSTDAIEQVLFSQEPNTMSKNVCYCFTYSVKVLNRYNNFPNINPHFVFGEFLPLVQMRK